MEIRTTIRECTLQVIEFLYRYKTVALVGSKTDPVLCLSSSGSPLSLTLPLSGSRGQGRTVRGSKRPKKTEQVRLCIHGFGRKVDLYQELVVSEVVVV